MHKIRSLHHFCFVQFLYCHSLCFSKARYGAEAAIDSCKLQDGAAFSVKMRSLMATVNQLSPSPPSSPNPRDTKLAGSGALV